MQVILQYLGQWWWVCFTETASSHHDSESRWFLRDPKRDCGQMVWSCGWWSWKCHWHVVFVWSRQGHLNSKTTHVASIRLFLSYDTFWFAYKTPHICTASAIYCIQIQILRYNNACIYTCLSNACAITYPLALSRRPSSANAGEGLNPSMRLTCGLTASTCPSKTWWTATWRSHLAILWLLCGTQIVVSWGPTRYN